MSTPEGPSSQPQAQTRPPTNRAYLIRCWQEREASPGQGPHWRFWMEEIARQRHQKEFNSLEALFAFFQAELGYGEGESPQGDK